MTVERTSFQIAVEGEGQAIADVRRVGAEMDSLARKAGQAERAASNARRDASRWSGLLARAKANGNIKRTGVEYGFFELNRGGFGLNMSAVRGAGGGPLAAATVVAALAHGAGHSMMQLADARDAWREWEREGVTTGEAINRAGLRAAEKVLDFFGVHTLAGGGRRLFGGVSAEQVDAEMAEYRASTFRTAQEQLRAMNAERRANAARAAALAAARANQAKTLADIEIKKREAHLKSDDALKRELEGLKNETLPVGLPRQLATIYRLRRISEAEGRNIRRKELIGKMPAGTGD